jgi:hypothetical protein
MSFMTVPGALIRILQANGQPDYTFIASFERFSALELLFDAEPRAITESICLYLKGKQRCQQG